MATPTRWPTFIAAWTSPPIFKAPMHEKDLRFAKLLLLINGAVPLLLLAWDAFHHQLGANPQKFAIHTTGMMALVFFMLTMAVTPVRKITGANWLLFARRTFG